MTRGASRALSVDLPCAGSAPQGDRPWRVLGLGCRRPDHSGACRKKRKQSWTERLRRGWVQMRGREWLSDRCILSSWRARGRASEHQRRETTMPPLRARMIEDMTLAGLAEGTQRTYIFAVRMLAAHYRRSPDHPSEADVRGYLLDLRQRDGRTAAPGGQMGRCEVCNTEVSSCHSCRDPSCPKCHTAQTREWLAGRQAEMLPVPYFHITVTVPEELREALRANQRDGYAVLMQASATAILGSSPRTELARDPRYAGGTAAVLTVLHTPGSSPGAGHGPGSSPSTRMPIAWSAAAGPPEMPGPGIQRAGSPSCRSRLLLNWCAAGPGRCCNENALIPASTTPCGARPGSSTSPPGATASEPCSTISPATSFASLSPMPGAWVPTAKRSASSTRTARPAAREHAASAAKNSCAASSSTCCRAASTRSAASACGIPHNATMPPGCGRCGNCRRRPRSTCHRTRSFRYSSQARSQYRRSSQAPARTVITGGWSSSAGSRRSRRWGHDLPRTFPLPPSGRVGACPGTPQRYAVTNEKFSPRLGPNDALDDPEYAASGSDIAVVLLRPPRLSDDHPFKYRASRTKSPYRHTRSSMSRVRPTELLRRLRAAKALDSLHRVHTKFHKVDFVGAARECPGRNGRHGTPFTLTLVELCVHFVKLCDRWLA